MIKTVILAKWRDGDYEIWTKLSFPPHVGDTINFMDKVGSFEGDIVGVQFTNCDSVAGRKIVPWHLVLNVEVTENDGCLEEEEQGKEGGAKNNPHKVAR